MYLAKYKSQSYPLPFRYRRKTLGCGCGCSGRKPLGDIWSSLDSAASSVVDLVSAPYNLISGGQLTQAQKNAGIVLGQDQILAVASSPGAQVSPSASSVALAAAQQNAADFATTQQALLSLPGPTNSSAYASLFNTLTGAQPGQAVSSNYGPLLLLALGIVGAVVFLK